MKKLIVLLFGILGALNGYATHIVGGEIELTHIQGESYTLALILYFDEVYGNPGAIDTDADVHIFRKADNQYLESFTLPIVSDTYVAYTNPECATGDLITRRIYYATEIELPNSLYDHPQGYYLVYERCCRNQVIQNIADPEGAGQTFYLEIPPVVKDGAPFLNSTPRLFPPLSDYACLNQPFYFNFGGTDLDGDSLVYSISIPLNGNSTREDPLPPPTPGPYSTVIFLPSYSIQNTIRGNPSLSINPQTGFLTIVPSELGLFVFAVKCEEFRNGEKIGEVRRDYQMLVLDCPTAEPPQIGLQEQEGRVFQESGEFTFDASLTDNCFTVYATDASPNSQLAPQIIPLTQPNLNVVTVAPGSQTAESGEIVTFEVCLSDCPELVNDQYSFLMVVGDNSCSLPLLDTIQVNLNIFLENLPPEVSTDLPFNPLEDFYEVDLEVGNPLTFEALGLDADNDSLVLRLIGNGFPLTNFSSSLLTGIGEIRDSVTWFPTCNLLPAGDTTTTLFLDLVLEDYWECGKKSADTTRVKVNLFYTPEENPGPEIEITSLTPTQTGSITSYFYEIIVGDSVQIDLSAIDPNGDFISVTPSGIETLRLDQGSLQGTSSIAASYIFAATCDLLGENTTPGEYVIRFTARDESNCSPNAESTVELLIRVIDIPQIEIPDFPNAFSPNGDNKSDVFRIAILPIDNCQDQFESVQIYNRWGEQVFESTQRDFAWDGKDHPAGVYFYIIQYRNSSYKGTINLLTNKP